MIPIWLIRHGESLGNVDGSQADTELSTRGVSEARRLAKRLETLPFEAAVTSPLRRAVQTAELALPGRAIAREPRLREIAASAETLFVDVRQPGALEALIQQERHVDQPESGLAFRQRVIAWLDELERPTVAFTHFGVIRELVRHCGGRRLQRVGFASIIAVKRPT